MDLKLKASSDIFIKYLFGSEQNKDLLLSFVNAVLAHSGFNKIIEIEIKNPFNLKTFAVDKESILDVKATDEKGRQFDIEVQSLGNESFKNRSLYYWARLYSSQIIQGQKYSKLKPAISINVLDFNLIKESDSFHNTFILTEKDDPSLVLTDNLVIHYLELPKLNDVNENSKLSRWLNYLKMDGSGDVKMITILNDLIEEDEDIKKAHREYQKFTQDDELREIFESRLKWQMDQNSLIDGAKIEGKIEGKIESAMKLISRDFSTEDIADIVGLPTEKVIQLKKTVQKT